MIDPTSYVLSFDFSKLVEEIHKTSFAYTEFGESIQKSLVGVTEDVEVLTDYFSDLSASMAQATTGLEALYGAHANGLKESVRILSEFQDKTKSISENIKALPKLPSGLLPAAGAGTPDVPFPEMVSFRLPKKVSTDQAAAALAVKNAQAILTRTKEILKEVKAAELQAQTASQKLIATVGKELESGGTALMSKASSFSGVNVNGGIIAAIISLITIGVTDPQRRKAEKGEMLNLFQSMTDSVFTEGGQKATKWFADFGEKAQFYYGIGRKEVQANVKMFIDAGYTEEQMLKQFDKGLSEVGSNIPTVALALDKYLGLATGSSAQAINTNVASYGATLDQAAKDQVLFGMAAQKSGMGVSKFQDALNAGGQALMQYGIDLKDVAGALLNIQKRYKEMGLSDQYAGNLASQAVSGIAQGVSQLTQGAQIVLANEMRKQQGKGPLGAYEAIQDLTEGWQRVKEGDTNTYQLIVKSLAATLESPQFGMRGASRAVKIQFLMQSFGMPNLAAQVLVDMSEKASQGMQMTKEDVKKQMDLFNKAFSKSGEQLTDLQKTQRDLIYALSNIGQGIMKLLGGILLEVITLIRQLPNIAKLLNPAEWIPVYGNAGDIIGEISAAFDKPHKLIGESVKSISKGLGGAKGVLGSLEEQIYPDLAKETKNKALDDAERANREAIQKHGAFSQEAMDSRQKLIHEQFGFGEVGRKSKRENEDDTWGAVQPPPLDLSGASAPPPAQSVARSAAIKRRAQGGARKQRSAQPPGRAPTVTASIGSREIQQSLRAAEVASSPAPGSK